jgi:ACS family hexuronate transporter-like MFS transporter
MKIPRLRWVIGALLLLASILNYVDRQALSILAPTIQADLKISDAQYGNIVSFFLLAYTIAYLVSGRIVDRIGTRLSMALFVGWWSVANALTGFAQGAMSLGCFRFLLGLGEAGGYTNSPKVVAEWFPPKDRGIAVGLYSVGGALGATIAPVIIIGIAGHFGWQGAFVVTGLLGILFVVLWLVVFRRPETHPWLQESERELILSSREEEKPPLERPSGLRIWKAILSSPAVWALMFARLLTDPVWYFYQFWMPKYLHTVRGFDQQQLSGMWKIFLAADAGFLLSGFVSAWFIRRGAEPRVARRIVLFCCAVLVPLGALVPSMSGNAGVFSISMIVVFAHAAWLTGITTYIVDLIPREILGTAFGFIAAGSALGGIGMSQAVPWVIGHFSYSPCFYAMVAVHPLAFLLIWLFARRAWPAATPS